MVNFSKMINTPRYRLRRQHKIKAKYDKDEAGTGELMLKRIIDSLDLYFVKGNEIESKIIEGDKFPTIMINDEGYTCGLIAFYLIDKIGSIYKLAFKEFIN